MVEIGHWSRPTKRQESKLAISLVDCTVRVSPTLARLIRKCAATEAGGASPHDALLASAGVRVGEIEALRDQNGRCAEELSHARSMRRSCSVL